MYNDDDLMISCIVRISFDTVDIKLWSLYSFNSPPILASSNEREPLLNRSGDSSLSRNDGQHTPPNEIEAEVRPPPSQDVIAEPAQPESKGLTPTLRDFGAGTFGVSHHVAIQGKKPSSSAKKKTTSTSCPQSSSSDDIDGKRKHHTDVALDRRRKKRVNRCLSNNDLQFVMDTGSSNGTSDDSPHTSMEPNKPSDSSKDATSSGDECIA